MRDVGYHDSNPMPLGPPIRTPTPAPQPREVRPGIIEGVDGRLSTDLPPPAPAPMSWVAAAIANALMGA